jgi:endonuclease YncB( thermonuclease family)
MTLTALVVLLVVLAVVWRLVRIAVRLILLALMVGAVPWYAGEHTRADHAHDPPAAQSGRVVRVADGDTLTVLTAHGRERVRLLGIDAPEASSTRLGRPDCGGRAATTGLRRLVARGTRVRLTTDPGTGDVRDRFGRLLAFADTRDGRDVGEAQVAAGRATVFRYQGRRFSRLARYQDAQARARAQRRGAWRQCDGRFHAPGR